MHNQQKDKLSLLFSGGKDSSLTALILSKIFEVELVTVTFGVNDNWCQAEKVAQKLRLPFEAVKLNKEIIANATRQIIKNGYPNEGIKYIHKKALEAIVERSKIVADGVRRNDRVPVLSLPEIMSFEDKFSAHYIQPLMGYSRKTIDLLLEKYFKIKEYKGDSFPGAEYEFELRETIKQEYGSSKVTKIFPRHHLHSIVMEVKI